MIKVTYCVTVEIDGDAWELNYGTNPGAATATDVQVSMRDAIDQVTSDYIDRTGNVGTVTVTEGVTVVDGGMVGQRVRLKGLVSPHPAGTVIQDDGGHCVRIEWDRAPGGLGNKDWRSRHNLVSADE